MYKKRIYGLMIAISLLLAFIISLQFRWMTDAENSQNKETDLHIQNALVKIEQELTISFTCVELFTKYPLQPGEGFYIIKQPYSREGFNGLADTVDMYYDFTQFSKKDYEGEVPYKYSSIKASIPISIDLMVRMNFEIDDTASFANFSKQYAGIDRNNFREIINNNGKNIHDLNATLIDSVIKKNLLHEGITGKYGFGIFKGDSLIYTGTHTNKQNLSESKYHIDLFSGERFITSYKLSLVFTNGTRSFISSWLISGCIALALLCYAFYALIKLYLSQARLSEMKTDFINNLTHEFNTPMANISLAIQTMQNEGYHKSPQLKKILDIISSESYRLRENIDRVLQAARLDKKKMLLHKEELDLVSMIQTIEPTYQLQCRQLDGDITFHSNVETANICGDEIHLLNTICNLLDNAVKYRRTEPEISIRLYEKGKYYIIEVEDNGKGMSTKTQKHIFDKFYRAHEGFVHDTKGFGLGLNYVKGIIELHNGEISVNSKPGKGSVFTIMLPKKTNAPC